MENYNNKGNKRRVTRQNWNPGKILTVLHGLWDAAYSVIKVAVAAVVTVLMIVGVCAFVFVGVLADYLEGDILPQAGVQLEGFDLSQPSYIIILMNLIISRSCSDFTQTRKVNGRNSRKFPSR